MSEKIFMWIACFLYILFTMIRRRSSRKTKATGTGIDFIEEKKGVDFLRLLIIYEIATFILYIVNASVAPERMFFQLALPLWVRWVGVGLFAAADLLFFWVHRHLGPNFFSNLKLKTDHELVTSGPYRRVRHPMYSAFYLNHLGMFLLTANWAIGITWLLAFSLVLVYRLGREERMMITKFGNKYKSYIERTGRFIPRLKNV